MIRECISLAKMWTWPELKVWGGDVTFLGNIPVTWLKSIMISTNPPSLQAGGPQFEPASAHQHKIRDLAILADPFFFYLKVFPHTIPHRLHCSEVYLKYLIDHYANEPAFLFATRELHIFISYLQTCWSSHLGKICLVHIRKVLPQHFVASPQEPKVWIKGCNLHFAPFPFCTRPNSVKIALVLDTDRQPRLIWNKFNSPIPAHFQTIISLTLNCYYLAEAHRSC